VQRARHRRDEPRAVRDGRRGHLPRGPLLPPARHRAEDSRRCASAPRTSPRSSITSSTLFSARHKRDRKTIERTAVRRLQAFDWPGNVRQLEHVLLNAWLLSEETRSPSTISISRPRASAPECRPPARSRRRTVPATHGAAHGAGHGEARASASSTSTVRARTQEEYRDAEKEKIPRGLTRLQLEPRPGSKDDRRPAPHVLPAAEGIRDRLGAEPRREAEPPPTRHRPWSATSAAQALRLLACMSLASGGHVCRPESCASGLMTRRSPR